MDKTTGSGLPRSASEAFSAQNASESECRTGRAAERHGEDDLTFAALRNAVVARLERAMPKEVYVTTHPGTVDETELARVCVRAPALLVSVLEVTGVNRKHGRTAADLRLGVYLVATPGRRGQAPDEIALALLPRALAVIDGEDWDMSEEEDGAGSAVPRSGSEAIAAPIPSGSPSRTGRAGGRCLVETRPDNLRADNLYSGRLGNVGLLALWGISWQQRVLMPDLRDFSEPANRPDEPARPMPYPWNDPLAEFLRAGAEQTETDGGLTTDDVFNVRTGEPANL